MKKRQILMFLFLTLLFSCETLPSNYLTSQSWLLSEKNTKNARTTLVVLNVNVDRSGGWDSIEKETSVLAPLYFWNYGCKVVDAGEIADYATGINIREREFNLGWRTKRSLAVEVCIWDYNDTFENSIQYQKPPLAVGRVITLGDKSFSSSYTIELLLSKAIKKAVKKLATHERWKKNA